MDSARPTPSPAHPAPLRRRQPRWLMVLAWSVRGTLLAAALTVALAVWLMTDMPGDTFRGPLPALTEAQAALRDELRRDVEYLAGTIGERNYLTPAAYAAAADYIAAELAALVPGDPTASAPATRASSATPSIHGPRLTTHTYDAMRRTFRNLGLEIPGTSRPAEILVIGAHYDSAYECPAANDNGSGVAALLALARRFSAAPPPARTLRFVAFANEEPPFFQTPHMGSHVYAQGCRARGEHIVGMLALETMGYYIDAPGSQLYPAPFNLLYPKTGNFIAFVGNFGSRQFTYDVVGRFRAHAQFPSEGGALPGQIQGIGWSDHWSFWQIGVPALMVTDTAPFRYPHYHMASDTPDKLDYERFARVVEGLQAVIADLVAEPETGHTC